MDGQASEEVVASSGNGFVYIAMGLFAILVGVACS